jgi:hypothetical protein
MRELLHLFYMTWMIIKETLLPISDVMKDKVLLKKEIANICLFIILVAINESRFNKYRH